MALSYSHSFPTNDVVTPPLRTGDLSKIDDSLPKDAANSAWTTVNPAGRSDPTKRQDDRIDRIDHNQSTLPRHMCVKLQRVQDRTLLRVLCVSSKEGDGGLRHADDVFREAYGPAAESLDTHVLYFLGDYEEAVTERFISDLRFKRWNRIITLVPVSRWLFEVVVPSSASRVDAEASDLIIRRWFSAEFSRFLRNKTASHLEDIETNTGDDGDKPTGVSTGVLEWFRSSPTPMGSCVSNLNRLIGPPTYGTRRINLRHIMSEVIRMIPSSDVPSHPAFLRLVTVQEKTESEAGRELKDKDIEFVLRDACPISISAEERDGGNNNNNIEGVVIHPDHVASLTMAYLYYLINRDVLSQEEEYNTLDHAIVHSASPNRVPSCEKNENKTTSSLLYPHTGSIVPSSHVHSSDVESLISDLAGFSVSEMLKEYVANDRPNEDKEKVSHLYSYCAWYTCGMRDDGTKKDVAMSRFEMSDSLRGTAVPMPSAVTPAPFDVSDPLCGTVDSSLSLVTPFDKADHLYETVDTTTESRRDGPPNVRPVSNSTPSPSPASTMYKNRIDGRILIRLPSSSSSARDITQDLTEFEIVGRLSPETTKAAVDEPSVSDIIRYINTEQADARVIRHMFESLREIIDVITKSTGSRRDSDDDTTQKNDGADASASAVQSSHDWTDPFNASTIPYLQQFELTVEYVQRFSDNDMETPAQAAVEDVLTYLLSKHPRPELVNRAQIPKDLTLAGVFKKRRSKGMFYGIKRPFDDDAQEKKKEKEPLPSCDLRDIRSLLL